MNPNQQDPYHRNNPAQPRSTTPPPSLRSAHAPFPAAQRAIQQQHQETTTAQPQAQVAGTDADEEQEVRPPMSQLAQAYTQYEVSLYTSGMDFNEIEQRLKIWRDQNANGASDSEIMYGPMPEDSQNSEQSQPAMSSPAQENSAQPQPIQPIENTAQPNPQPQQPAAPETVETTPAAPQQEEQNLPSPQQPPEDGELKIR